MKLSPTQLNALRLAAEVPSCLKPGQFNVPTEQALESLGLIESSGGGDHSAWLITDAGKAALADDFAKRLAGALAAEEFSRLRALFADHYWDSLEPHKAIILQHIDAVLIIAAAERSAK